jgi:hypothetical protein
LIQLNFHRLSFGSIKEANGDPNVVSEAQLTLHMALCALAGVRMHQFRVFRGAAISRGAVTRGMTGLRSAVALGGAACQLWQQGQWQKLRSMKTLPRVVEVVRQSLHGHKLLTCHRVKQNTIGHAIGNTISVNVLMRLLPRLLVVAAARLVQPAVAARSDPWKRLTKTQLRSMETLPDDLYHTRDVSK